MGASPVYLGVYASIYAPRCQRISSDYTGEPGDSVKLRAAELMGKHYGLFADRIEAVVPERSSEEIQIELEAKLQQFLLPEAG